MKNKFKQEVKFAKMDERYNGWRNRETWLINLWFGDDDMSIDEVKDYFFKGLEKCPYFIQDFVYASSIDWDELAEAWKKE